MNINGIEGTYRLRNGIEMPYLGLGVFQIKEGSEIINTVKFAIETGYRHFDTAAFYGNENGVGEAVRQSGIKREDVFITTKVWNSDQRTGNTLKAFDESLKKLGMDYVDLYLIHWPVKGKYLETWKAFEKIYKEGKARAIGVSNFLKHHLEDLLPTCEILPMVNQVEFHPYLVQQNLIDYCSQNKIQYEAWSPLMQGHILGDKSINKIADKYGKTSAQIILRWSLQKGVATIPKSARRERIISNSQIFDFEISDDDMIVINNLDRAERIDADPDNFDF